MRIGSVTLPPVDAGFCAALSAALGACDADIILLQSPQTWYAKGYRAAMAAAFKARTEMVGMDKAHLFDRPTRSWRCLCNRKHATLGMTAVRRSFVPAILRLLGRGKPDIAQALWKMEGFARAMVHNKGGDGRLRAVSFRDAGERLRRQDPDLAWLSRHMGPELSAGGWHP